MNKIAILIPTKDRTELFTQFAESWKNTTKGHSDVIVGLDRGCTNYNEIKRKYPFVFEEVEPGGFLEILNTLALKYSQTYKYIAFMEDDCTFNTLGWETKFIQKLDTLGPNGIVWGNDLLNKEKLVGLPFMNSSIVLRLGFMSPPQIKCLWADYFWKSIVDTYKSGHYFDDVIVEHHHYSTNKSAKDNVSSTIEKIGTQDYHSYMKYSNSELLKDLKKLS